MRNVFAKGDVYFNTGDLMAEDQQGFISFRDRVGDTFRCGRLRRRGDCRQSEPVRLFPVRWKGENVATTEVAEALGAVDFLQEVNVYGVEVPGKGPRARVPSGVGGGGLSVC